jgi:hypothetical protein
MEAYGELLDKTSGKSTVFRLFPSDEITLLLNGEIFTMDFAGRGAASPG